MNESLRPLKAYKDPEFINSPAARSVRLLSEYLNPYRRFRQEKVRDTIVFFGSARAIPRQKAEKAYQELMDAVHSSSSQVDPGQVEAARIQLELSRYYDDAVELSRLLTSWSLSIARNSHHFVVCSGGGPGIMEAANLGAHLAGGKSVGLNISLPLEQLPNPYITASLNFDFHYFFMRKYWFVYLAKALIVFPGGFGTMDELWELLTLIQTGKITKKMVVLLYGSTYWNEVVNFQAMLRWGTIAPEDIQIFRFADTPNEAFEIVREGLERYYVRSNRHERPVKKPDVRL
jgi:uncharacterized protein (TIGR00730 family)